MPETITQQPAHPLNRLKLEKKKRRLSLREISERSGVHPVSVSGILNGRIIQPRNLAKIEAAIEAAPVLTDVTAEDAEAWSGLRKEIREDAPDATIPIPFSHSP
jgi:transcriptional regulator with XRE-family HTH domain